MYLVMCRSVLAGVVAQDALVIATFAMFCHLQLSWLVGMSRTHYRICSYRPMCLHVQTVHVQKTS